MIGRPRVIKVERRTEKGSYTLYYYDCQDRRQRYNTGLKNEKLANRLRDKVKKLHDLGLSPQDPSLKNYDKQAYALYYQEFSANNDDVTENTLKIISEVLHNKDDVIGPLDAIQEIERLREELQLMTIEAEHYKTLWESHKDTERGRVIQSFINCPTLKEAIKDYKEMKLDKLSKGAPAHRVLVNRFEKFIGSKTKISEITVPQITKFLNLWSESNPEQPDKPRYKEPRKRYNLLHKDLGTFFRWCYKTYDIPSIMHKVEKNKKIESGPIKTWFDYSYIEELINGLDLYWRAAIGTMAYAGVRRNELIGIRNEDLIEEKYKDEKGKEQTRYFIQIVEHEERQLKNVGTARTVHVSPTRLEPILKQYLKEGLQGNKYLFPTLALTSNEMWAEGSFNSYMKGHKGGKKKKPQIGVVPQEVTCRSLRRSFNQNHLRMGMTREQVATVSGHDMATNAQFYARIESKEILLP